MKEGKNRVLAEVWGWVWRLALAVVIAQAVHLMVFQPVSVKGESMTDTLQNGEIMYVSKPEYLLGDPARGDVVEIRSNQVYVNGEPLDEPYLTPSRNDDGFSMAAFALGADEYFVMGDNRDNSHDSRNYYGAGRPAAITRKDIVGKVRFVMWPLGHARAVE